MKSQQRFRCPECVVVECGSSRWGANLCMSLWDDSRSVPGRCHHQPMRGPGQVFKERASNYQCSGDRYRVLFELEGGRTVCAWTMSSPASQKLSMGVCFQQEPQILSTIVIAIADQHRMFFLHEADSWEANGCESLPMVNLFLSILLKRNRCTRSFFQNDSSCGSIELRTNVQ